MENNTRRGPGRPTDKRKDAIIRLRIDSENHAKLHAVAKKQKVAVSELLRVAIEEIIAKGEKE